MGVFGEKHTSLTREQKRQLIHQADTHKLRPTEVCDWVQATWGLRIARVTVYSILHKQRASLMAGHKDLYQTMHNTLNGSSTSQPTDGASPAASVPKSTLSSQQQRPFSNTQTVEDACLGRNKESGRVNKHGASPNKNKNRGKDNKDAGSTKKITNSSKRSRSNSVMSDQSNSSRSSGGAQDGSGEGARWEGQLKRVREPASVELDRAMVKFLKGPDSVDNQGRRLNDAELQSHALRLAQSIPSASRMRCSFGWLRHFKRRLGVQWAADRLGRHRWVIEMDHRHQQQSTDPPSPTSSDYSSTASSPALFSSCEPKIKQELGLERRHGSAATSTEDDDEEYHSTYEFGSDGREATPATPTKQANTNSGAASTFHGDNSILSIQRAQQPSSLSQDLQSSQTIMASYPSLFGTLPPLHIPSSTTPTGTISPLATSLDPKLMSTTFAPSTAAPTSAFGMSVDGKMRRVPTKDEAYEMLQSLLMYYEQDHSYIGEQQTLLLPRWIHQQRQIVQQTHETEVKMMWIRQQQQQQQQNTYHALYQPFQQTLFPFQSTDAPISTETQHPYHRYQSSFSSTTSSGSSIPSPLSSPNSPVSPLTPHSPTMGHFSFGIGASSAGLSNPFVSSTKSDPTFSSVLAGYEQQILRDPSILFSSSLQR